MLSPPNVPLCVRGFCPLHMCDGFTCLCHQGSSIITINTQPRRLTDTAHQLFPQLRKKTEDIHFPSLTPLHFTSTSSVHFAPSSPNPETPQRRCKKTKKGLKTVMFVDLHSSPLSFLFCSVLQSQKAGTSLILLWEPERNEVMN